MQQPRYDFGAPVRRLAQCNESTNHGEVVFRCALVHRSKTLHVVGQDVLIDGRVLGGNVNVEGASCVIDEVRASVA